MRTVLALAVAIAMLPQAAPAADRIYHFKASDAAARAAWDGLLKQDADLAKDARRKRFDARRDLRALRVDLDGDGRAELLLYADLMTYCGSAGCMVRILTQRAGRWAVTCETYIDDGIGLVVEEARPAGWSNLRGTYRVTWRENRSAAAGVSCLEGETIPRAQQGR